MSSRPFAGFTCLQGPHGQHQPAPTCPSEDPDSLPNLYKPTNISWKLDLCVSDSFTVHLGMILCKEQLGPNTPRSQRPQGCISRCRDPRPPQVGRNFPTRGGRKATDFQRVRLLVPSQVRVTVAGISPLPMGLAGAGPHTQTGRCSRGRPPPRSRLGRWTGHTGLAGLRGSLVLSELQPPWPRTEDQVA